MHRTFVLVPGRTQQAAPSVPVNTQPYLCNTGCRRLVTQVGMKALYVLELRRFDSELVAHH